VIHREVETKPPRRPVEDPCDRGQREHEERVRRCRQRTCRRGTARRRSPASRQKPSAS
jgi:hypothetical protein